MSNIRVWKISVGGTTNIKLHKKSFKDNVLYIGFDNIEEKNYPYNGEERPRKQENQVALLQHDVSIGDLVVVPRKNLRASFLAKIIGPYQYVEDSEFEGFPRRFEIIPISKFGDFQLNSLGTKKWDNTTVSALPYSSIDELYVDFNIEKDEISDVQNEENASENINEYKNILLSSKNLILRGAPGTGKTYLAKEIAKELTDGNEDQIGFVQFHPSYDYTDFVEGLRPVSNDNSQISFELQDGIFKKFCHKANEAQKTGGQDNFDEAWNDYLEYVNNRDEKERLTDFSYLTVNSRNNFNVNYESKSQGTVLTKSYVYELYKDENYLKQTYYRSQGKKVLETLRKKFGLKDYISPTEIDTDKKFVFIIDEINRGEISKIFGELFFSIDPGYRGEMGSISTQYSNLHETNEKFYIPENVYIIGTMNDIDRSVDTFDFAMRRRFRFVEITAESQLGMLDEALGDGAEEAKIRLRNLNASIEKVEELSSHYHVGPSYFLKLQEVDFDYELLWSDYIKPLLEDYLRGSYEEVETLETLKKAFDKTSNEQTNLSTTGDNESDGNDDTDNR
ncbi:AAA family ATPase [Streptococcus gordonii]|uniref:AAA family ATPase n=1 Tax=Streptococcus gordonii TaxID=1302 RepID=UPI0022841E23|nr:AAA family ATPase [Streptococcus gordonii]MCY7142423.1 AAA family ATPase [Streptococcus gordonii]MCY7167068.1 AAA family ATPase [Streptococcus gordonii]